MDRWENLVERFPLNPDTRNFQKLLQTASVTLGEDLAEFEIRRYLKTLFASPVSIITTIEKRRGETAWMKSIADAFKLINEVVEKHGDGSYMEGYFENLSNLCMLSYDATTSNKAYACLASIVRRSELAARNSYKELMVRFTINSGHDGTCKASLAILMGTVCEYHLTLVEELVSEIFKIYRKMLEQSKNTDTITNAILKGLNGLFKSRNLPTSDLMLFYNKIGSMDLIKMDKHEAEILSMLQHHAELFKEKVALDVQLRQYLWAILAKASGQRGERIAAALFSVYQALCDAFEDPSVEHTIKEEILPKIKGRTLVKYTALCIVTQVQSNKHVCLDIDSNEYIQSLEFEIRNDKVTFESAVAIKWCINSSISNSARLLQNIVKFYTNLPTSKRKEVVVDGVLNADDELRQHIVIYLITETCLNENSMEEYLPLWEMLFDTKQAETLVKHSMLFSDYVMHLSHTVQLFLDERNDGMVIPEKLQRFIQLTTSVLSCQDPCHYTRECCSLVADSCLQMLRDCGSKVDLMELVSELMRHYGEELPDEIYQYIDINRGRDEALLCASCVCLVQAPVGRVKPQDLLVAFEITFSRNDVDAKMLSQCLEKFDGFIKGKEKDGHADQQEVFKIIGLVEKLRLRRDLVGKDARQLQKDIVMFLGRHSYSQSSDDVNNNLLDHKQLVELKLERLLTLDLCNTLEGGTIYKLNLEKILHQALIDQDLGALDSLMTIMCANLSVAKKPALQMALCRVLHALCRVNSCGLSVDSRALLDAARMCATPQCARQLTYYISVERSPGVRRLLSDALAAVLEEAPGTEVSPIDTVAEYACQMMESGDSSKKRAAFDIIQSLLEAIKSNHSHITSILPNVLVSISKTGELDSETVFELASKLLKEHISLFEVNELNVLVEKLLNVMIFQYTKLESDFDVKNYKYTIKICLDLILNIFQNRTVDVFDVIMRLSFKNGENMVDLVTSDGSGFIRLLYILAMLKDFSVDGSLDTCVKDSELLDTFFEIKNESFENNFEFESSLSFIASYNGILLDTKHQETNKYVASLLKKMTPSNVIYLQKMLRVVLPVLKKDDWPEKLIDSYLNWLSSLPLDGITASLKNLYVNKNDVSTLKAVRIMSNILNVKVTAIECWPMIVYDGCKEEELHISELSNLTDAMTAVKLTAEEVKRMMVDGGEQAFEFVKRFVGVFFEVLVAKPFLLMDEELTRVDNGLFLLIDDIVKWCNKKKCSEQYGATIIEMVDEIWPLYMTKSSFHKRCSLLQEMLAFDSKLGVKSNPMSWAVEALLSEDTSLADKAVLVRVLPGGSEYRSVYRKYASLLPPRLSEMWAPYDSMFRALLDVLAANGDEAILEIVITWANADDTKGWWDEAFDSCAASLAMRCDLAIHRSVYRRCFESTNSGVCCRLMVPLLRYSSSVICEQFYSEMIKDLLDIKRRKRVVPSNSVEYLQCLMDGMREITIMQIAFEKIPSTSLQQPSSVLYKEVANEQNWYMCQVVCKLCMTLRKNFVPPEDSSDDIKSACRLFQCAAYNCVSAALCCRRPDMHYYDLLFASEYWSRVIDPDLQYNLPLKASWTPKTKRHAVPVSFSENSPSWSSTLTLTRTVRTRIFADQFSENPLHYDLFNNEVDAAEVETQDIQLTDNELNSHEIAATLTGLLCHLSPMEGGKWRAKLVYALQGDLHRNAKWLLAQAVCNAKEDLKSHASALCPALLALIEATAEKFYGVRILNGLHVDIVDTISYWGQQEDAVDMTTVLTYLINTCFKNISKKNVYDQLLDSLTKFLVVCKKHVKMDWNVFGSYFENDVKQSLRIMIRIAKNNIYINNLLPNLLDKFTELYKNHFSNMAELFGLTLACCDSCQTRTDSLERFLKILDSYRQSNLYINIVYYSQLFWKDCCDSRNFRLIPDLIHHLPPAYKTKCLRIISKYISGIEASNEETEDLFASLKIYEMIAEENNEDIIVEAIGVVKNGFRTMEDGLRRKCVERISGYCDHSLIKVRRAASEVILEVFKALSGAPSEPSGRQPKRPRHDSTPLLNSMDSSKAVLTAVGVCCIDDDPRIADPARVGVAECLSGNMGVRFVEAFLVTILYPMRSKVRCEGDLSVCVPAFLDVLFYGLKNDERFQTIKLKDAPLATREMQSSGLLTSSRAYQGTMSSRRFSSSGIKKTVKNPDAKKPGIDVQVPIARLLDTILKFSKINSEACQAICIEMMRILKEMEAGFEFSTWMSKVLIQALTSGLSSTTALVIEGCRLLVDKISTEECIAKEVEKLKADTLHTEGEDLSKTLHEDIMLRKLGNDKFFIGTPPMNIDFAMEEEKSFSLHDLVNTFGKLGNWDQLTIQKKEAIKASGLPALWAKKDVFENCIQSRKGIEGWFSNMCTLHFGSTKKDVFRFIKFFDLWPRNRFVLSTVTEMIEWEERADTDIPAVYPCDIKDSDCLAEWAARLMIRSAHVMLKHAQDERTMMLFRSDELKWCVSANERELYAPVLQCVKRNYPDLHEDESLAWLQQKMTALRGIGLEKRDDEKRKRALEITSEFTNPKYLEHTPPEVAVAMFKLILDLNCDLKSLTSDKLDYVLSCIDKHTDQKTWLTDRNKKVLTSVYQQAMVFFSESNEASSSNIMMANMSDVLRRVISEDLKGSNTFLALVLDKLTSFAELDDDTSRKFLDQLQHIIPSLDQLFIDILVNEKRLFSASSIKEYAVMVDLEEELKSMEKYKEYLQLVNDPRHCLSMYCEELMKSVLSGDPKRWANVFRNMKMKMFQNPSMGTEYQVLVNHKDVLYSIENYDESDVARKSQVLKKVVQDLDSKEKITSSTEKTLKMSQLCRRLVADESVAGDKTIARLLGLPPGVSVFKFDDKVTAYTDSQRCPCLFRVVLSNGESRKYLHKCGEPLRVDSAALGVQRACHALWGVDRRVYNVTPLSDDCGVIEFLDGHERLGKRISEVCTLEDFHRIKDEQLILTPAQELARLHDLNCARVPSYALRSAIEKYSLTMHHFITKKKNYLDTLAIMTVITWFLGVGDRHLQNILCSDADGSVVSIDWANVFKFGEGFEPAPARLTRNLLAVCDSTVLEGRIQTLMKTLRGSFKVLMPYISVVFQWMGEDFHDKRTYIENTLRGTQLSYEIAKEVIEKSTEVPYKEKYVEFYKSIFPSSESRVYSVEEQVTVFLKHCTDRRVLGLTRRGWEPWI